MVEPPNTVTRISWLSRSLKQVMNATGGWITWWQLPKDVVRQFGSNFASTSWQSAARRNRSIWYTFVVHSIAPSKTHSWHVRYRGMHIRCPHCRNPIEVIDDDQLQDLTDLKQLGIRLDGWDSGKRNAGRHVGGSYWTKAPRPAAAILVLDVLTSIAFC